MNSDMANPMNFPGLASPAGLALQTATSEDQINQRPTATLPQPETLTPMSSSLLATSSRPCGRSCLRSPTPPPIDASFHSQSTDGMEVEGAQLDSLIGENHSNQTTGVVTWPMGQLPLEVYAQVFASLGREDLKSFRLTCQEFDNVAIHRFFQNVVVSLSPEICGESQGGLQICESIGHSIKRFALSLELDENDLYSPPIKTSQEAIPCFWGLYGWPHNDYRRYADLSGLEDAADNVGVMKAALRHLENVINLGLSCDPGLGYMLGSHRRNGFTTKTSIFRTLCNEPETVESKSTASSYPVMEPIWPVPRSGWSGDKERLLEQMTIEAGYGSDEVPEAIALLVQSRNSYYSEVPLDAITRYIRNCQRFEMVRESEPWEIGDMPRASGVYNVLIPIRLTTPQKEMLLELEWVHRAMIQSYVLAIIDNGNLGCFSNLRSLTIARIPSCHIPILARHDLWESLDRLEEVSLGVIADWRKVSKGKAGEILDEVVSPTGAVPKVFELLHDYIGRRDNILSLRFEWICGGEFARSIFQRNKYILPAPFVKDPEAMVLRNAVSDCDILRLPHIKQLFLKNCWCSPHVFLDALDHMAVSSLETANFESFSLSGPPTDFEQRPLLQRIHEPQFQMEVHTFPITDLDGGDEQILIRQGIRLPSQYTWAGLFEHFSPSRRRRPQHWARHQLGTTIIRFSERFTQAFTPNVASLADRYQKYKLESLSFKSCGYVAIDDPFVRTRLILAPGNHSLSNFLREPDHRHMLHDYSKLLGVITSELPEAESDILGDELGMSLGWDGVYHPRLIREALDDGDEFPGVGRFTGTLDGRTNGSNNDINQTLTGSNNTFDEGDVGDGLFVPMAVDDDL